MKTENATKYKLVIGFACMIITLWSCKNDVSDIGKDLLLPDDLVSVRKYTDKNINAYTMTDGNQRTDEPTFNLLGTYNDPTFGKVTADFACQFRLSSYPDSLKAVSKNPQIDSLVLVLLYKEVYGDTLTPQHLKVYELASNLDINQKYYQDVDLKNMAKGELVGEKNYIPKSKLFFDSLATTPTPGSTKETPKDLKTQEIRIKLSQTLLTKLMSADSLTWSDNDKFIKYFKGLYIEAGDLNQGGGVMKINALASGSNMAIHFHTSKTDSLVYVYNLNDNCARVSRFAHDYSKTQFAEHLNKTDVQDSLIYLQTTGGLRTKVLIPNLDNWADSANLAINKAELIFKVDPTLSDTTKFIPAEQLVLTAIDSIGNDYLPSDVAFSQVYFGGTYNKTDQTYRFNIAKHMLEALNAKRLDKKKFRNYGFYLSTAFRSSEYRRIVLKGATSKTGIKLDIVYSKVK